MIGSSSIEPIGWISKAFLAGAYPVSLSPSEGAGKLRALLECGIRHIVNLMEAGRTGSEDGLCGMKKTGTGSVRKKVWMLPMSISRSRIWADSREGGGHSMRSTLA